MPMNDTVPQSASHRWHGKFRCSGITSNF